MIIVRMRSTRWFAASSFAKRFNGHRQLTVQTVVQLRGMRCDGKESFYWKNTR
jgi:hypothetical protein